VLLVFAADCFIAVPTVKLFRRRTANWYRRYMASLPRRPSGTW